MIAKLSKKNKSSIDKKILVIIAVILIIIDLLLLLLIKFGKFESSDIDITEYLQKKFLNKTYNNKATIPPFIKIVHILNDTYFPYLIILIIFNFYTVYDCFILVNVLSLDYIISFCFNLIYFKPPYTYLDKFKNNNKIDVLYCGFGWGFPSEECILMVSFYLALWKIVTNKSSFFNQTQKISKYILLLSIISLIIIYCFGILLMGYYYLSHIVFSALTGLIIYFTVFEFSLIDLLNSNKFILFIKNKCLDYIIRHLIIFVILSLCYIIATFFDDKEEYQYEVCNGMKNKTIFGKSGKFYSYLNGSFTYVILFLSNIFSILGIIIDIKILYKGNISNFSQFNFPQEIEELINNASMGSFSDSINITKETLWNKTSLFISFLRLIIVIIFFVICFIPYFIVKLTDSHICLILFIKFFLPSSLLFLGIFFYFKPILRLMRLTNFTLESILDDR